ncbi:MAG: tetratricopeptide repeat protein [Mariprofundaceae bacterium]
MTQSKTIIVLCLTVGITLTACGGKLLEKPTTVSKAPASSSLSQMSDDFLYLASRDAIRNGQHSLAVQFLNTLVLKRPDQRLPRTQLAELLLRANRADLATPHIDILLGESTPSSATNQEESAPHILKARALAMTKEPDKALEIVSTLLSKQPDLLNARLLHVSLLISLKKVAEAHLSITEGLISGETLELRKIQSDLLIRQNRIDEAIIALEAMQKLDLSSQTPTLLLSQIALRQKNMVRAEQLLRNHIENYPGAMRIRNALARLLVQSGRSQEAITIYKGLVRDTGGTSEAVSTLGLLYYQLKDYQNAAKQFRMTLKISPNDQSRFYLAACLEALEKTEEAKLLYQKVEKKSVAYIDAQLRLAGLELFAGKLTAAKNRTKAILAEFSDAADAYMLLSSIYLNQKKYQQLLDETESALHLPRVSSRLLFNRAVAHESFKQYDEVESSLKRLLSTDPKNAEALNFLGYVFAEQGVKLVEAEALIKRALEEKPDDGYYLDSLAWVYFKNGNYQKAIETQALAIKQISDDPVMFEHMGDMLWKSKKEREARDQWEKALQLKHSDPGLIKKKIAEGLKSE